MDLLIVEDSVRERERLHELFTNAGYDVKSCDSAVEAEKLLQREAVKLAILDIGLTDQSGSVLFQKVRSLQPRCSVVIFTGNPSPYLKQRFLKEGAADYILKGSAAAGEDALKRLVNDLIGSAGGPAEGSQQYQGVPLEAFLREHISSQSQMLFYDVDGAFPACGSCGSRSYIVTFSHQVQVPPTVQGNVLCAECGKTFELTVDDGTGSKT